MGARSITRAWGSSMSGHSMSGKRAVAASPSFQHTGRSFRPPEAPQSGVSGPSETPLTRPSRRPERAVFPRESS